MPGAPDVAADRGVLVEGDAHGLWVAMFLVSP